MPRLAAVLAAALLLAGCTRIHQAAKIDDAAGEKLIRRAVTEQVQARVRDVSCPNGLKAKEGRTFRCRVTGTDGSSGDAVVTEKNDRGKVAINAPFLHMREV